VRGRLAIAVAFLALFLLAGGHWAILQTGAWTGMIVAYTKDGNVSTAISRTFDGKHPCALCCAVRDGRKQEEKKVPGYSWNSKKTLSFEVSSSRWCAISAGANTDDMIATW